MRKIVAKRIRKLVGNFGPTARKVYRRFKKAYRGLSIAEKKVFFIAAEKALSARSR